MFNISQSAIEQVVQDIKDGVEYPDFWANRYEDEPANEQVQPQTEQAEKTVQAK